MKKYICPAIIGILGLALLASALWTYKPEVFGASPVYKIYQGGTGTSTKPTTYGRLPVWDGLQWSYMATSSLDITASGLWATTSDSYNWDVMMAASSSLAQLLTIGKSSATTTMAGGLDITNSLSVTGTSATSTFGNGIRIAGGAIQIDKLANCNTVDTDANGKFYCGTDADSGATVANLSDLGDVTVSATSTDDILQIYTGSTDFRNISFGKVFHTYFSGTTTDALTEGSVNKYWAQGLFNSALQAAMSGGTTTPYTLITDKWATTSDTYNWASVFAGTTTDALDVGSTNLYWTQTLFNTALQAAMQNGTTTPYTFIANRWATSTDQYAWDVLYAATTTHKSLAGFGKPAATTTAFGDLAVSGFASIGKNIDAVSFTATSTTATSTFYGGFSPAGGIMKRIHFNIASSSGWLSSSTMPLFIAPANSTITKYQCAVEGGTSVQINVTDGKNDADTLVCDGDGASDTSITTNPNVIQAAETAFIEMASATGVVQRLFGYVEYYTTGW